MPYTYPDPEALMVAFTEAANLGATVSTSFPSADILAPHIQVAWDGTPSEDENREATLVRFTVWTPRGQRTTGKTLASELRGLLLEHGGASVWRVTRSTGRAPGIDPDTELPFVTFAVTTELRPVT